MLDFSPLKKAITSMRAALASTEDQRFMSSLSPDQRQTMKAGAIQNFEFTYELCWKMLLRQLKEEEGHDVGMLSRRDLYRLGAKKGIIDDPEAWFVYHRARNETSHTYDEQKAEAIYQVALRFEPAAETLLKQLETRQA